MLGHSTPRRARVRDRAIVYNDRNMGDLRFLTKSDGSDQALKKVTCSGT